LVKDALPFRIPIGWMKVAFIRAAKDVAIELLLFVLQLAKRPSL